METERHRQQAEGSQDRAEDERQDTEKQRTIDENKRQIAENQREVGEHLRGIERTGERMVVEYNTRVLLIRLENVETQLSKIDSRLESVEALLKVKRCTETLLKLQSA
jgi:hypothetical protein